ncbi:sulfotransferase [Henriciella sp. AS95]|uniref:sulfotransferase n=1 Tax=Henriciella sp. AS95 TaxID=3135782 RepID=UPI00317A41CD
MIEKLFLSVGAMKAGTTWLHHQLQDHPEIVFTPEKEIHYFCAPDGQSAPMRQVDRVERFKRVVSNVNSERFNRRVRFNLSWYTRRYLHPMDNDAWYESLFAHGHDGQWCADFSNLYSVMDSGRWEKVRSVADKLRVVYTLRHPLKRMWSQLVFFHEYSGSGVDVTNWSKGDFERFYNMGQEGDHVDYASNVARLRALLSEEELEILFFEDDREKTLNRIETFLDIEVRRYSESRLQRRVNASKSPPPTADFVDFAAPIHHQQVKALTEAGLQLPQSWNVAA